MALRNHQFPLGRLVKSRNVYVTKSLSTAFPSLVGTSSAAEVCLNPAAPRSCAQVDDQLRWKLHNGDELTQNLPSEETQDFFFSPKTV